MTRESLESIRKRLLTLRETRLQQCRRQNADAAALLDEGVADVADQGLTDSLKDCLHLLSDAGREEILAIDEALERLRDGSYDTCEGCGKKIGMARLQTLPFTRMCLACQQDTRTAAVNQGRPLKGANLTSVAQPLEPGPQQLTGPCNKYPGRGI